MIHNEKWSLKCHLQGIWDLAWEDCVCRIYEALGSIPLPYAYIFYGISLKYRDSLAAQLEITLTKADSEQLARSIAEEQYSDLEKEKIMKELEIKEMMARHKQELTEKDATIASVSKILGTLGL